MKLHIGTCSWKYDSWRGLIYSADKQINYLEEYSRHYRTVEVDQWFWSLFGEDTAVLPKATVVSEYGSSVPDDFVFCAKVPNSITLTPGTLSIDVDEDTLIVHWVDCPPGNNVEATTREIAGDFERHLRGFLE